MSDLRTPSDEWVVEYDENSVAWLVNIARPDIREALQHGHIVVLKTGLYHPLAATQ